MFDVTIDTRSHQRNSVSYSRIGYMTMEPIGTIASLNASLTVAVFDAQSATEWVHTKPAATKQQFTGHPAEILRGLAKGEDTTAIDVGASGGYAFELEGKSGRIDVYKRGDGLVLLAPPRAWWLEHHADHAAEIDALFADALGESDDATDVGPLELASGKLAIVYAWHKKVGSARDLAAAMTGDALAFGDGYGDNVGLLVDIGAGEYAVSKREIASSWDADQALVAMRVLR